MKTGKLLISVIALLLIGLVLAEECSVARPYYGSVNCKETNSWSDPIFLGDGFSWTCEVENCRIIGLDRDDFTCSGFGTTSELILKKEGVQTIQCDNTIGGTLSLECKKEGLDNYEFRNGERIDVDFNCKLFGVKSGSPEGDPQLKIEYKEIKLELNIDSGQNFQSGTEFCNSNSVWSEYKNKQLSNNYALKDLQISDDLETSSEGLSNIPLNNIVGDLVPSQLEVGEGYWFVYDWVERPSLIVKLYNNQDVWCNPIDHSLIKLEEVNTLGNNCYLIPTQRIAQTVDCCSTNECKGQYDNQAILCTDEFKCGFEKSCNSDIDCGGNSKRCEKGGGVYNLINSYCDKSELDSYGKGSCKVEKEIVQCCTGDDGGPDSCGSGSNCNYNDGCEEISYKGSNNEIKTGVMGEKIEKDIPSDITGKVLSNTGNKSNNSSLKLIGILILIGVVTWLYFFTKKDNKTISRKVKKDVKPGPENEEIHFGKHCVKCGGELRENSRFCTKCGTILRK